MALALLLIFMCVEVVVAVVSHSLALLADAGHMLTDAGALWAAIFAINLAQRPASPKWTFGLKRAEILSAGVNGVALLVVSGIVLVSAIERLINPTPVQGSALLIVASLGVVINLAATVLLSKGDRSSLNLAGAFAHIVTDLWAFVATLGAGIAITFTSYYRADGIASLVIVVLMTRSALALLKEAGKILLEGAPASVDLGVVRDHILSNSHVQAVHDLHSWVVTSDLPTLSAHIVLDDSCFEDGHAPQILDTLQNCLSAHFDVEHSTFQLEPASHFQHEIDNHE